MHFPFLRILSKKSGSYVSWLLYYVTAFLFQMFTSFIDTKIVSQWETPEENLQMFDSRIQSLKEKYGLQMVRTPTYEKTLPSLASGNFSTNCERADPCKHLFNVLSVFLSTLRV